MNLPSLGAHRRDFTVRLSIESCDGLLTRWRNSGGWWWWKMCVQLGAARWTNISNT